MQIINPLFSSIIQVGLGGKSYQPEEDNALHQFLPQLVEFNRILEKLQTKLEEVRDIALEL